jgi:hypothetical protein
VTTGGESPGHIFEKANRALRKAQANPLLMFGWSLFVGSVLYTWTEWRTQDQKLADLRQAGAETSVMQDELGAGVALVEVWGTTLNDVEAKHLDAIKSLDPDALTSSRSAETAEILVSEGRARRAELSSALAKMNNTYFSIAELQALKAKLIEDLTTLDESLARAIAFLERRPKDAEEYAAQMREFSDQAFLDQRKGSEAEGRKALFEQTYVRAQEDFNARVRVFNAQRDSFLWEGRFLTAAAVYSGAWGGGWIGWGVSRWRRKRKSRVLKTTRSGDARSPDTEGDMPS